MSDNPDETEETEETYQDRTAEEVQALTETFQRTGANYVAQPAPGYDVHGLWHCFGSHQRTGYALHAIALHWMLSKSLEITTELIPHRHVDVDVEKFPADRYDMLFKWMKSPVGYPHLLFASYPPEVAMHMRAVGPPPIPYCAFEGTRVSSFCRDLCNGPVFKQVWVVSDSVRNAMIAGGVDPARVLTVRPPVCDGPWTMPGRKESDPERPFTFGALGTWQKRKGMHDLVRAYFGEFKREENVQLVIRTSAFSSVNTIREFKTDLTEEIAELASEFGDDDFPRSKKMPKLRFLIGTDATDQQVIDWLASLDCYANPSYGEGLGIPHIWAKANGVPMVSTGYGAVGDLLAEIEENSNDLRVSRDVLVPHTLAPVDEEMLRIALMFEAESQWGVYDAAEFGRGMRKAFEAGYEYDEAGAAYVRQAFSLENCVPTVKQALTDLVDADQVKAWNL
jgi:glycosyltransferase involved in cell wall biosynthesis